MEKAAWGLRVHGAELTRNQFPGWKDRPGAKVTCVSSSASSPDPSGPLVPLPDFKLLLPGFQRLLTYTLLFVALTSFSLTGWFAAWPCNRHCSPTTGTGKIHLPPPGLRLPGFFLVRTSCGSCQQPPPATSLDLVCDADRWRPHCYLDQVPTLR